MLVQNGQSFFDTKSEPLLYLVSFGCVALICVATIILKAWVMTRRFSNLRFTVAAKYSLILTLISAALGVLGMLIGTSILFPKETLAVSSLVLIYGLSFEILGPFGIFSHFIWIPIIFGIQFVIDLLGTRWLIKPKPSWSQAALFSIVANVYNALTLAVLGLFIWIAVLFFFVTLI